MSFKLTGSTGPSHKEKPPTDPGIRIHWEPIQLPAGIEWGLSEDALAYLLKRGFDPKYLKDVFIFGDWPELRRIVIPYFDRTGGLIFIAARSYDGGRPKYMYPKGPKPLYVPDRHHSSPAVIVEGQLDAVAVSAAGFFAVAIGGSYLAPHVEEDLVEELNGRRTIICLDGDALDKS